MSVIMRDTFSCSIWPNQPPCATFQGPHGQAFPISSRAASTEVMQTSEDFKLMKAIVHGSEHVHELGHKAQYAKTHHHAKQAEEKI